MPQDFTGRTDLPLGLRNNNPGDLRTSFSIPWMGQTGSDSGFCTFTDTSYGLRALAVDLTNAISGDGMNTLSLLINHFAPPSENDTTTYINSVAGYTGWDPNASIDLSNVNLGILMRAIMNVELGTGFSSMLSDDEIQQGIAMIPQTLIDKFTSFFVNTPAIATASTLGGAAVLIVLIFIAIGKTPKFLNKFL